MYTESDENCEPSKKKRKGGGGEEEQEEEGRVVTAELVVYDKHRSLEEGDRTDDWGIK